MSCRLFSRWFGASSRHQQSPTVAALESQLEIELLGYDSGMIFQGHFSCSRKLPGAFFILRGWNFVLFAKRPKFSTGGCCRYIYTYVWYHHIKSPIWGTMRIFLNLLNQSFRWFPWLWLYPAIILGIITPDSHQKMFYTLLTWRYNQQKGGRSCGSLGYNHQTEGCKMVQLIRAPPKMEQCTHTKIDGKTRFYLLVDVTV